MSYAVQPCPLFVIGLNYVPRRLLGIGSSEHCIPSTRIVVPTSMRFEIHRTQLPLAHGIFDPSEKSPMLLWFADLEPIFDENNLIVLHEGFEARAHAEEVVVLLIRTKTHYMLDKGAVIPATIEKNHFASSWEFLHVALCIELRFFALCGRRQSNMPENSRADALHDAMDHPALPCCISAFEHHCDFGAAGFNPFLHFDELGLEFAKFAFVLLLG